MKEIFTITNNNEILEMFEKIEYGTLALCENNLPYSLPINFVQMNNELYFHGSKKGKKMDILKENLNASFSIVEDMSVIPSYFSTSKGDACPSTHMFKSIIIQGKIEFINDANIKAQALEALMQKQVPLGTYTPLNHSMYKKAIEVTCVYKLVESSRTCKFKVGQNFNKERAKRVIFHLEQRASKKDLETLKLIHKYYTKA